MSFLSSFESNKDGVNDTVEFVIRVAIVTLSAVILVVVLTLAVAVVCPVAAPVGLLSVGAVTSGTKSVTVPVFIE